MASSLARAVETSSEQLEKYCSEDRIMDALGQWMATEGPLTWNTWQKCIDSIRARYLERDPDAGIPEGVQYPKWSSDLWEKTSRTPFGPQWHE